MVYKATATSSKNAISWSGADKILYTEHKLCIRPPPFAQQCTLFKRDAIFACAETPKCKAVTCADPAPYLRNAKYQAAICQLRTSQVEDEMNHGMCVENGNMCENIKLERMTVQEACARATLGRSSVVHLQMLDEIEEDDIVLDYRPNQDWFMGAMNRAKGHLGWHHVKFRTPFDHVKIAGNEFYFLRMGDGR